MSVEQAARRLAAEIKAQRFGAAVVACFNKPNSILVWYNRGAGKAVLQRLPSHFEGFEVKAEPMPEIVAN